MARFLLAAALGGCLGIGCGNARPPEQPREDGPVVPFFITTELYEIDPYPGGPQKDIGSAYLTNTPQRRPEQGSLDHVLLVFSKVPFDRFQREVAPLVGNELHVPFDVGVVWRPGFHDAAVQAVVVSTHPLASFDDIESAEPSESHEHSVRIANGKMTEREALHAGVQVTLGPAAKERVAKYAKNHPGHPLVVAYDGWAAGFAAAGEDASFDFRFSWLDDEAAAAKAADDFIAKVRSRRPRR
jgi:hypothetical protein